jgi:hypothetical protein
MKFATGHPIDDEHGTGANRSAQLGRSCIPSLNGGRDERADYCKGDENHARIHLSDSSRAQGDRHSSEESK